MKVFNSIKCKYKRLIYNGDCRNSGEHFHFKDCEGCVFIDFPNSVIDKLIKGLKTVEEIEKKLKKEKKIQIPLLS